MKILELFSGTGNLSRVGRELGHECITVDINGKSDIDTNVLNVTKKMVECFDMVWMSPPCTTYSLASISHHRGSIMSQTAKDHDVLTQHVFNTLCKADVYWFVENPRATLRKMPWVEPYNHLRTTISFCQYGDVAMKPTDIWNNAGWVGKMCSNGSSCHEASPRGSKTGTQGKRDAEARGRLPDDLCRDVINHVNNILS